MDEGSYRLQHFWNNYLSSECDAEEVISRLPWNYVFTAWNTWFSIIVYPLSLFSKYEYDLFPKVLCDQMWENSPKGQKKNQFFGPLSEFSRMWSHLMKVSITLFNEAQIRLDGFYYMSSLTEDVCIIHRSLWFLVTMTLNFNLEESYLMSYCRFTLLSTTGSYFERYIF